MRCGMKVAAKNFGEESCGDPDADPWRAHEDYAKRVSVHPDVDLSGEFLALCAHGAELVYKRGRMGRRPRYFTMDSG